MRVPSLIPLISCLIFAGVPSVRCEELLLHEGPVFSTPGLRLKLDSGEIPGEELKFRRMFYVDSKGLPRQVDPSSENGEPTVSAERAIHLVAKQDNLMKKAVVTRLELLALHLPGFGKIDYYLIEYLDNGSTEHRIILMDERVLKPRLEKQ